MTTDETATRTAQPIPTARRRLLLGLAAALAAGTTLTAPMMVPGDWENLPSASAQSCSDVQVVFARGTGESPGAGRVGDAFVDELRSRATGKSVDVYAVDYPASHDFLQATNGANDASAFIQGVAAACPDTKIVLGGYSQGAAVIDIVTVAAQPVLGFDNPLPPEMADHVAAVAVFGNPSNRVRGPLSTLSALYGHKTIDLCNGGDPVCSNGNDNDAHSLYVQTGMASEAAGFAEARL